MSFAPSGSATDRLRGLNPSQREAVLTVAGPLLVLAGAGTGKTRVITYRMAELIARGVRPDRILSVTFTNKAAKEMQERAAKLLGKSRGAKPFVSTFHSLCVKILRQEIGVLGYPADFTIYDRGDQESAARTALRDIRVPETSLKPADLLGLISQWKMAGVRPSRAGEAAASDREVLAASAYRRYQNQLKACAAVDFDDLLLLVDELFARYPDVLARQQTRFDHVQIDEYQDTNGMQFAIVEALVRPHRNICVVGDDDQSIYGWRGAELRHILGFPKVFPGTKVVRLQDNYRCTAQIIDLANRLVRHNVQRHDKRLVPHKSNEGSVRFAEFPDEQLEAEHIVKEINYLVKQKSLPAGDFAILFRTNEQPRVFETELRKNRIPYVILGSMSFFDRREIRDILSYLRAIQHPGDDISLLRIVNVPARGIGDTTTQKIIARAVRTKTDFWSAADSAIAAGEVNKSTAASLAGFRALLGRYRAAFQAGTGRLSGLVRKLIDEINYESEVEKQYKDARQQMMRMGTLDELVDAIVQYESKAERPTITEFLENTALGGRDDADDKEDRLAENGVKLMTLHSAKGLEFPRVYLVGLEEGILPHKRSLEDGESPNIEEERRLAYVGVTRARDFLTVTRARQRVKWGKPRASIPSRFLFEMREAVPEGEGGMEGTSANDLLDYGVDTEGEPDIEADDIASETLDKGEPFGTGQGEAPF
jgi:DNA helicase-2/ATP-dependent DNA helicase PcrA